VREDQLDPVLVDAIKAMQPGELSQPIQGIDGFYILALRNRRISQGLSGGDASLTLQQVFVPLAGRKESEVAATAAGIAQEAKTCQDMDAAGKRLGSPQSGRLTNVRLTSLPTNIRNAISGLQDGQASAPIPLGDGVMVLMVCERSDDQSAAEMRNRVRNMFAVN
jgi:peptidyl-prolyl cis-trans isomerase SurA